MRFLAIIAVVATSGWAWAGDIRFMDTIGTWDLGGKDGAIVTSETSTHIQYRIRGNGPAKPQIEKGKDWFIAMLDKDHFLIYLGDGKFHSISQERTSKTSTSTEIASFTMSNLCGRTLPPEVLERVERGSSRKE